MQRVSNTNLSRQRLRDKRITILKLVSTSDDGFPVETWEPLMTLWAYYRQTSASEFYEAAAVNVQIDAMFEIAWRNDLDETMRICFHGKEYTITRIDDFEGYRDTLRIYAKSTGNECTTGQ
ncbi:phage head closure protein [Alicyclobacillus shizuokensis]|uniref:phage head closure protein n=1 Tax=Alicyclobacillus shizuokensis TaxID=392014 RepID=UPI00082FB903|nr:phage head closure protein [Alicyclobacillus shizuokensis]